MTDEMGLGAFLRTRRNRLRPADVGIAVTSRRRVTGLRRSELATLAGVSSEYYARLEQGRDRNPSADVLRALAVALQLDEDATAHLFSLARPTPPRREPLEAMQVPADTLALLKAFEGRVPAYVYSPVTEVLAANAFAQLVLPTLRPGNNFIRGIFLDPDVQALYEDVAGRRSAAVAALRWRTTQRQDPQIETFVAEMCDRSSEFACTWADQDVTTSFLVDAQMVLLHPDFGRLELFHQKLVVPGPSGLGLGLLHAAADSPTERALDRLRRTGLERSATAPAY